MSRLEVRKLHPSDDRSSFRSGQPDLDRFFHRFAGQNQFRHHIGTTYVAVEADNILGFVTVAASEINAEELQPRLRRRLPLYPLPVLRLARLAVSEQARGRGVGTLLLRHTFLLAKGLAADFGCIGVVVDAKAQAIEFYRRYGFQTVLDPVAGELNDRPIPTPLFLFLESIP
jgi:GNAT superfamily N-acetyltransferase